MGISTARLAISNAGKFAVGRIWFFTTGDFMGVNCVKQFSFADCPEAGEEKGQSEIPSAPYLFVSVLIAP